MKRILITGASGLLGLNLCLAMDGNQYEVIGAANTEPFKQVKFKSVQAELTEPGIIERLLEENSPEVIIHCAAIANVDDCETKPELAEQVNSSIPGEIAREAAKRRIKMVHISTDAVFDGARGGYTEEDIPNPLSVYARTKLGGEKAVLTNNPDALVARVNFYGWSMSGKRSLAEWFVYNLLAGNAIKGFTDIHFCPFMVLDLADTLLEAVSLDLKGIYHVVGAQPMSKYDFGVAIANKFGLDDRLITPASVSEGGLKAARSPNLTLSTKKLVRALGHPLPVFANGLQKLYDQYNDGFPQFLKSIH